jgi:hypothetical protein
MEEGSTGEDCKIPVTCGQHSLPVIPAPHIPSPEPPQIKRRKTIALWGLVGLLFTFGLTMLQLNEFVFAETAFAGCLVASIYEISQWEKTARKLTAYFVVVVFFGFWGIDAYKIKGDRPWSNILPVSKETYLATPLSMKDLYDTDFKNGDALGMIGVLTSSERKQIKMDFKIVSDFEARSKYMVVYIPDTPDAYEECKAVATDNTFLLKMVNDTLRERRTTPGETAPNLSEELPFSGRVYIYLESDFSLQQSAALESYFANLGLSPQFRGVAWRAIHMNDERKPANQMIGTVKTPYAVKQ